MIDSEQAARQFCAERLDATAMERLDRLQAALIAENGRQNLVSAGSLQSVWQRHFADSVQLLDHVAHGSGTWLDLGSGAGFPGLVLAIARPHHPTVLVESRKRRAEWLQHCVANLELTRCEVAGARLENVASFPAEVITARAFAPLRKLLSLSARFSTPHTVWLLPKGRSAAQELSEQPTAVRNMFHVEQSRTDPSGGILVGRGSPSSV